ncbi:hypothetical protein FHR32_007309 [Streptosporangium album]|uniref:Uncharacterized protein n=1 Tax=Streptosporangium album TaxID=47479 RepID=A0A7W7S2W0_9ACTN|nr:hypothetical protein [Streptosporangium album]MBB4942909.1 hypothetical protein [Streptosporangium album]
MSVSHALGPAVVVADGGLVPRFPAPGNDRREYAVTIVLHPLSRRRDATAFHLESGRLCVLASRHRHACIVVARAGIPELLDAHPSTGRVRLNVPIWRRSTGTPAPPGYCLACSRAVRAGRCSSPTAGPVRGRSSARATCARTPDLHASRTARPVPYWTSTPPYAGRARAGTCTNTATPP